MRLSSLITEGARLIGDGTVEIGGLASDSRAVQAGELFAALAGARTDGRKFVADALGRGACAILGPCGTSSGVRSVPVVEDAEPRRALALMAARFFGRQPQTVVTVTGTNGKTSTAVFARQLWRLQGYAAASLGTLGIDAPGRVVPGSLTTPDPIALHRALAQLADEGTDHLALEASSHGLDQRRLDGLRLTAAAFTQLSRDHFDYHGSEHAYLAAKRRLFRELLPAGASAVLNADAPEFAVLCQDAREQRLTILDYGRAARRFRLAGQRAHADGQDLELELDGIEFRVRLRLVGAFQAWNALAALGLVVAAGADLHHSALALEHLVGAPGRMQLVARHANGAAAFVDYAHTPDSIEKALAALRPHTDGRLHIVFGCGGDRDPGKRPLMGRAAVDGADVAYLTDDNPRSEDPSLIRAAVKAAAPSVIEIGDRASAIRTAFLGLAAGDVLLVAGKGHETGQIVGRATLPFDDAEVCRAVAREIQGTAL